MKIAVISKDERQVADLVKLLRQRDANDEVQARSGTVGQLASLSDAALPDALVLDQPSVADGDLEQIERLSHMFPRMAFVLLSRDHSPEFLLQAMRAGVREVLATPVSPLALNAAMERIADKLDSRGHTNGKVLAFISCKGGSGSTFLATNLAYALAEGGHQRVALIDMNLQFGDASMFVSDQKPLATLSDVAQQIHRLDPSFLASSMLNITPNYGLLAAPSDPAHANDVKPDHIDSILKLARRQYDFVLLDVGRNLDAVSVRALDHADLIFPILQTTLPYIRDSKRLLGMFRALEYAKEKIHLIVNRHDKGGEIRLQDLAAAFDTDIYKTIPNHYDAAAASVNQGVPILKLTPTSPIAKALQELAHELGRSNHAPRAASTGGWLSRLLQRG